MASHGIRRLGLSRCGHEAHGIPPDEEGEKHERADEHAVEAIAPHEGHDAGTLTGAEVGLIEDHGIGMTDEPSEEAGLGLFEEAFIASEVAVTEEHDAAVAHRALDHHRLIFQRGMDGPPVVLLHRFVFPRHGILGDEFEGTAGVPLRQLFGVEGHRAAPIEVRARFRGRDPRLPHHADAESLRNGRFALRDGQAALPRLLLGFDLFLVLIVIVVVAVFALIRGGFLAPWVFVFIFAPLFGVALPGGLALAPFDLFEEFVLVAFHGHDDAATGCGVALDEVAAELALHQIIAGKVEQDEGLPLAAFEFI